MLHAVAREGARKVTVVLAQAYGAGVLRHDGRAYEPDLIVAWPTAEISVMAPRAPSRSSSGGGRGGRRPGGQEGGAHRDVPLAHRRLRRRPQREVDDVIDPRETRPTIIRALEMAATSGAAAVEAPWGDAGVVSGGVHSCGGAGFSRAAAALRARRPATRTRRSTGSSALPAGTSSTWRRDGQLTRALVAHGCEVVAVEAVAEMRAAIVPPARASTARLM